MDVVVAMLVTPVELAAVELLIANEVVDKPLLGTVPGDVVVPGSAVPVELVDVETEPLAGSGDEVVVIVRDAEVVKSVAGPGVDVSPLETASELLVLRVDPDGSFVPGIELDEEMGLVVRKEDELESSEEPKLPALREDEEKLLASGVETEEMEPVPREEDELGSPWTQSG